MTDFPDRNLDVLRARTASGRPAADPLEAIERGLREQGGQLVISTEPVGGFTLALHFGQEDDGSDMAAGASYALEVPTIREGLRQILAETGWDRRPYLVAQEDDGEQD